MIVYCSNTTRTKISDQLLIKTIESYLVKQSQPINLIAIDVAIVGSRRIAKINASYRGISYPTDILTFVHQTPVGVIGEIYLNPQLAEAKGYRLEQLVIHGLNHCQGVHH